MIRALFIKENCPLRISHTYSFDEYISHHVSSSRKLSSWYRFAHKSIFDITDFFAIFYSIREGILSYILTIFLLFIIEPSELIVFPFTTGLLGLALGVSFLKLKRRIWIVSFSATCLLIGIMIVLDVFRFPVLGPAVHTTMNIKIILSIFIMSFLYCWIYAGFCRIMMNRLYKVLY